MTMEDPSNSLDWEFPVKSSDVDNNDSSTDHRFVDKVIVITGAGGQLGRAGCVYFAQKRKVKAIIGIDLQANALRETYEALPATANNTTKFKPYVCDVTNPTQVQNVVNHIIGKFQKIDLLWNNAGYQGKIAPILQQDATDFANVMNINVTGMFIILQAVSKAMVENNSHSGAAIVNTASVAGLRGTPAMAAYASSKAAVLALTVCAAKELAVHGIRVNAISPALIGPGFLWTRQNELHAAVGPPYFADTPDAVAKAKIQGVPLQRLGTPEEVVQSVAFLLSNDASYTTGINLTVDGGMAAGLKA